MAAAADPDLRATLKLGRDAQVLLFGTEGATDPALYRELLGTESEAPLRLPANA